MKTSTQAVDEAAHQRGLQLFKSGSYAEAAAALARALSIEETSERWNDWASAQFALNRAQEAERGFRRAMRLSPENAQAAANLAMLLAREGRPQEAIPLLKQSCEKIESGQKAVVAQLLEECKAAERFEKQADNWQKQLELGVLELKQSRDLAKAQRLFEQACALNPNAGEAWFLLGLTSFHLGMFEAAQKTLQRAEICGHKTALGAQTRGDAFYNQGQFEEARAAYQTALRREPQNAAVRARLGLALVRSGYPEKGLTRLKADLTSMPHAPELHEGLILSYVALGQIREAAEAAEQKLKIIPDPYAGDYLRAASLWAQLFAWKRATSILEKGLKRHEGDAELQRALGEARQANGALTLQSS
jgi:tetratricopeptide (TPR) repeat protein